MFCDHLEGWDREGGREAQEGGDKLCGHLEGWDREGGRETKEGGDMGIYVYI